MTIRIPWIVAGVVSALLVIVGMAAMPQKPAKQVHDATSQNSTDEVAQLRAEVADLRQSAAVSNGALLAAAKDLRQAPANPQEKQIEQVVDPDQPKEQPSDVEVRAKLDGQFNSQRADPSWSKQTTTLLNNHISQGIPSGSKVVSIECKSSMCRVESKHNDVATYQKYVNEALLFPQGGWDGPLMTQITNPGVEPVTSVAYLLRDGEDMERIATQ